MALQWSSRLYLLVKYIWQIPVQLGSSGWVRAAFISVIDQDY